MFKRAPVAFLCTRMSFDFAKRVRGPKAPDLAIFALLSSCVARFVMQPTALHCTSTFGDIIWRMRGVSPPRSTMETLFSAADNQTHFEESYEKLQVRLTVDSKVPERRAGRPLYFNIWAL